MKEEKSFKNCNQKYFLEMVKILKLIWLLAELLEDCYRNSFWRRMEVKWGCDIDHGKYTPPPSHLVRITCCLLVFDSESSCFYLGNATESIDGNLVNSGTSYLWAHLDTLNQHGLCWNIIFLKFVLSPMLSSWLL